MSTINLVFAPAWLDGETSDPVAAGNQPQNGLACGGRTHGDRWPQMNADERRIEKQTLTLFESAFIRVHLRPRSLF
jgi:hypothetical protein